MRKSVRNQGCFAESGAKYLRKSYNEVKQNIAITDLTHVSTNCCTVSFLLSLDSSVWNTDKWNCLWCSY